VNTGTRSSDFLPRPEPLLVAGEVVMFSHMERFTNDEPASVLLERIRAERDARATLKKPGPSKARETA
jgi:hypothetical protein